MKGCKGIALLAMLALAACVNNSTKETGNAVNKNEVLVHPVDSMANSLNTGGSAGVANHPNDVLITCNGVGKISMDDSYQDLLRKAGKENVQLVPVVKGAGQNSYVTKIWKGTAAEITINWQERKQPYQTIQSMVIDAPSSIYTTQNGIKLGSPMSLVNKLNGKPFILIGFAGQNSGTLMNFNGGNLITQVPCLRMVFSLPATTPQPKEMDAILTPNIINSDHVAFKVYDPRVVKLIINAKS